MNLDDPDKYPFQFQFIERLDYLIGSLNRIADSLDVIISIVDADADKGHSDFHWKNAI